jgi:hypothetical protein
MASAEARIRIAARKFHARFHASICAVYQGTQYVREGGLASSHVFLAFPDAGPKSSGDLAMVDTDRVETKGVLGLFERTSAYFL